MELFNAFMTGASMLLGANSSELPVIEKPKIPIVSDCSEKAVPMIIFFKSITHGTLKTNPRGVGFNGLQQDIKMCKSLSVTGLCERGEDIIIAPYTQVYAEMEKRQKTDKRDLFVTPLASLQYAKDVTRMYVKKCERDGTYFEKNFEINEGECNEYTQHRGYLMGYHVGKFSDDITEEYIKFSPPTIAVLTMLYKEIVDKQ